MLDGWIETKTRNQQQETRLWEFWSKPGRMNILMGFEIIFDGVIREGTVGYKGKETE